MFKILVALKSNQAFKCSVTIDGKSKQLTLPQLEGLTFLTSYLHQLTITYKDQTKNITLSEDTLEFTGEFNFTDVSGLYYIVIIPDVEKPSKLSIKQQNESPKTDRPCSNSHHKKKQFKTPNKESAQRTVTLNDENLHSKVTILNDKLKDIEKKYGLDNNQHLQDLLEEQNKMLQNRQDEVENLKSQQLKSQEIILNLSNQVGQLEVQIMQLKCKLTKSEQDSDVIDNLVKQVLKNRTNYQAVKNDVIDTKVSTLSNLNNVVRLKAGVYQVHEDVLQLQLNEKQQLQIIGTNQLFQDYLKGRQKSKSLKKY